MDEQITNSAKEIYAAPSADAPITFFRDVLGRAPQNPASDFDFFCKCWQQLSGAKWVWFWMSHNVGEDPPRWEIMAIHARDGQHSNYAPEFVADAATGPSVLQYCSIIETPQFVDDLQGWRGRHKGMEYRVFRVEELEKRGCKSVQCIPFVFPANSEESFGEYGPYSVLAAMRGGICLYFEDTKPPMPHVSDEIYEIMAKATASAVASSFAAEQQRILHHLDSSAARYLTRQDMKPAECRKAYLKNVIDVIKDHLHVKCVTVFYRTEEGGEVECIATTGLANKDGELSMNRLPLARYRKGESTTGTVFKTGKEFIWQMHLKTQSADNRCVWWETPLDVPHNERSWAIWPIKAARGEQSDRGEVSLLGVIRCVDNRERLIPERVRVFDPIQLQTLSFIAAQLAPILETMAASIRRHEVINFVKHDLYAPLRVIEDQADALQRHLDGRSQLSKYTAANIKASGVLARNMVGSLGDQQAFAPEPTLLEGDIIARLCTGLGRFAWVENRMQIKFTGLRNIPSLRVDRNLVERAVCNLLLNAIKYGFSETVIDVTGEAPPGDHYVVKIENIGIEIDRGDENRIFEGNYRAPKAQERKLGLGLGLKIARAAMRRNGGDLCLERAINPTTFTLLFPKSLATQSRNR